MSITLPTPAGNVTCDQDRTNHEKTKDEANTEGKCVCFPSFEGDACENKIDWMQQQALAQYILTWVMYVFFLYWIVLKIINLRSQKRLKLNLSIIALFLTLAGLIFKIAYWCFVPERVTLNYEQDESVAIKLLKNVFTTGPVILWMAAISLCTAFWFQVLARKMNRRMARRTRIACIVLSCSTILAIPGLFLFGNSNTAVIGALLVLIPLVGCLICLIVVASIIPCLSNKGLSERNAQKRRYATKVIFLACFWWLVYVVGVFLFTSNNGIVLVVGTWIHRFCEGGMLLAMLLLVDRRGGPIRLTLWAFCGKKLKNNNIRNGSNTTTSTGSTSTSSTSGPE